MDLRMLAKSACAALLNQTVVEVHHLPGWKRDGFPLPIKREKPSHDGSVIQSYRPMAILEYVNDSLSGELASRLAKRRHAEKEVA